MATLVSRARSSKESYGDIRYADLGLHKQVLGRHKQVLPESDWKIQPIPCFKIHKENKDRLRYILYILHII